MLELREEKLNMVNGGNAAKGILLYTPESDLEPALMVQSV